MDSESLATAHTYLKKIWKSPPKAEDDIIELFGAEFLILLKRRIAFEEYPNSPITWDNSIPALWKKYKWNKDDRKDIFGNKGIFY